MDLSHREAAARSRLDPMWFDYLAGGAGEERAVLANRDAVDVVVAPPELPA